MNHNPTEKPFASTDKAFTRRLSPESLLRARVLLRTYILLVACAALPLLASCSERQSVRLASDGSGSAEVQVTLSPMLVAYLHDLMSAMGDDGGGGGAGGGTVGADGAGDGGAAPGGAQGAPPIFDLGRISAAFGELPGVSGVVAQSPSDGSLHLRFSFESLPALFDSPQLAGVRNPVSLASSGGLTTLRFFLDRANLQALTALPPLRDNPILLALVPKGDKEVTEAQELDLLDYAFGDYAPQGSTVADVVRASEIRVSLTVAGRIVSQQGGTQTGSTVVFAVPLLRLLTMERPIDYSVVFRGPS